VKLINLLKELIRHNLTRWSNKNEITLTQLLIITPSPLWIKHKADSPEHHTFSESVQKKLNSRHNDERNKKDKVTDHEKDEERDEEDEETEKDEEIKEDAENNS